jgi:small-conductance mechanosensitive channel
MQQRQNLTIIWQSIAATCFRHEQLTNTLQKRLNKVLREKRELERKIAREEEGISSQNALTESDPGDALSVADALAEEDEEGDDGGADKAADGEGK